MDTNTSLSRAAAEWLAHRLDSPGLLRFLGEHTHALEHLFRGFKVCARNIDKRTIRTRFRGVIERDADFRRAFLAFPDAPWARWAQALGLLDEGWLCLHWRTLARGVGGGEFLVALALDERAALRERGQRALRTEGVWGAAGDPEAGQEPLPGEWRVLCELAAAGSGVTTAAPPAPAPGGEDAARAERERDVMARELERIRERARKFKEQHAKTEAELRAEQESLREQLRAARREVRDARATTAKLTSELDARIRKQIDAFRCRTLGMTPELERLQEKLDDAKAPTDLLARVHQVIEAQGALNERYGVLSELRQRIAALIDAEERLTLALDESVVVLPELTGVLELVREERLELTAQLPGSERKNAESPLAEVLLGEIRKALGEPDDVSRLNQVAAVLETPIVQDVLRTGEGADIADLLQKRRHAIAERMSLAEHGDSVRGTEQSIPHHTVEIWHVDDVLASSGAGFSPWLFVDGYNLLKRVDSLSCIEQSEGLAAARERLLALCRGVAHRFGRLEVVFDGLGMMASRETRDGVTVVFTAQTHDSQNADRYIMRQLNSVRHEAGVLWLVTDDYGLRYHTETLADAFLPTDRFYRFLRAGGER